jgi:hypothetical protein
MGIVSFQTDVNKTVDVDVDVDLDVLKTVTSLATVSGNLATAEASADAIGSGGGTGTVGGLFVIDDFNTDAYREDGTTFLTGLFVSDSNNDGVPVSGITDIDNEGTIDDGLPAVGQQPPPPLPDTDEDPDINTVMGIEGGRAGWTRTLTADLTFGGDEIATTVCANCDAGESIRDPAAGGVSNFTYTGPGINLNAPGEVGAPTEVRFVYSADLDGAVITFTFDDDPDPDEAVETGADPVVIASDPLPNTGGANPGNLTPVTLNLSAGETASAVWDNLEYVDIEVHDEGTENLDLQIDQVELFSPGGGDGGTLAETETFAQVIEGEGSFSFSQSIAAASGLQTDDFDLA